MSRIRHSNANLLSDVTRLPVARLLLFAFFIWAKPLCAQEFSYKKYGVKEGLPGLVIYHCVQDKNGFTWFATSRGVSRFDGKVFKNFSKEDGLPDNEILKLYVDKHNNVWFISFLGIPSVFHNGKITQINCTGVFYITEDLVNDSILLIGRQIKNGEEYFGYYRSLSKSGNWDFSSHFRSAYGVSYFHWPILRASTSTGVRFYFSYVNVKYSSLLVKTRDTERNFLFSDNTITTAFVSSSFIDVTPDRKGIVFNTGDSIYYSDINGSQSLVSFRELGLNTDKPTDATFLFCENDSVLWLCTKNRGLIRVINYRSPSKQVQHFFSKSFCSSIAKDQEGGYWITTLDDGVYYVPNLNFFNVSNQQGLVAGSVKCIRLLDPKRLAAGFSNGRILTVQLPNLQSAFLSKWGLQNKNNRVLDIWPYNNDRMAIASDRGLYMISPQQTYFDVHGEQGIKGIHVKPDSMIVSGSSRAMLLIDPYRKMVRPLFEDRVTCVNYLDKKYFIGTLHGAYALVNDSLVSLDNKHPALKGIISHIDIAPDSALWISTRTGIVILKGDIVVAIDKSHGLLSNMCKHVLFDSMTAWISTDQGISRVDYQWRGARLLFAISNIREVDGLLSSDVNQTAIGGDYIWAATEDGISFFSKHYTGSPYNLPPVTFTRIVSGNKELIISDTIKINRKKSNLLIELFCPSYRSCGNINYEYRLNGLDTAWRTTSNSYIEFSSLPFGEFILEVSAVNKWGQRTVSSKKIIVINTPPFWRSTWFLLAIYIVTTLLLTTAVYLVNRDRHRKKEKAYKMNQKMRDLEIMALRAQMNPHFIFNCMSSIQYYILRNDAITANLYLHKFSALIRRILQFSNVSTIPLTEEIKLLSLYLELEKMRLQDRLDFHILVNDKLDPDVLLIPPMIIQPYIENAVKHGVSPLQDKKGIVTVTFERSEDYIHCTIDDNGIGINASRQNSHQAEADHMSIGNSITEHRISTINSLRKNKIVLKIFDKQERHGTETGTVVHLSFPVLTD